jgi:hypothetical protein
MLWVHVATRSTLASRDVETFASILDGRSPIAVPPPGAGIGTKANEKALGIKNSVYAYLGRSFPRDSNHIALCLKDVPDGEISPFDTGGLVNHHHPVCGWKSPPTKRQGYLRAYSFDSATVHANLSKYPGKSERDYLRGVRPTTSGPHDIWPQGPKADLWSNSANDWRAWAWEWRGTALPVGDRLVAWSCSTNLLAPLSESDLAAELWEKFRAPDKLPMKVRGPK